jgi:transposase
MPLPHISACRPEGSPPKPSGGRRHAKLDPHRPFLTARIAEKADMTMPELSAELTTATGTKADPASLSRWPIRNGYRFKKRPAGKRTRSSRHQSGARGKRQPRMRLELHRLIFLDRNDKPK